MNSYNEIPNDFDNELFCLDLEERLETVYLPTGDIIENCCTKIFTPCGCNCDCDAPNPDPTGVNF
jgi:hypothetical protein